MRLTTRAGLGLALLFAIVTAAVAPAHATDWYVDGAHGNDSGDGSAAHPFKSAQYIFFSAALKPGDTIHLLPTTTYMNLAITASGTAAQPITVTGDHASLTMVAGDGNHEAFYVGGNYLVVEYFEIVAAPGTHGGITVSPPSDVVHDITVAYNVVCNAGGNGISTIHADHITISHNTVCGNGHDTSGGLFGSGISMWDDRDSDRDGGVKMIVDGNIVYANTNVPSCRTCADTDGNGIIVDDNRNTQSGGMPYRGTTAITNNVVFGNGGNGIHVFSSDHAIVTGNTVYHNSGDATLTRYDPGEIDLYACADVVVANNIVMSDGAARPGQGSDVGISVQQCRAVTFARNLAFNDADDDALALYLDASTGVKRPAAWADLWGDPQFAAASLDPEAADFRVAPLSPAMKHGDGRWAMPDVDILGAKRKRPSTLGAYEKAAR